MVGHTGVYKAIEKAIMTVDECAGNVIKAARKSGYDVMVIADHGNADQTPEGHRRQGRHDQAVPRRQRARTRQGMRHREVR